MLSRRGARKGGRKKQTLGSVQSWHDSSNVLSLKSLFIAARHKSRNASSIVVTSCSRAPTGFLNETESSNYCTAPPTHTHPPPCTSPSLNAKLFTMRLIRLASAAYSLNFSSLISRWFVAPATTNTPGLTLA